MQNKFLYQILCVGFVALMGVSAVAQESEKASLPAEKSAVADSVAKPTPKNAPKASTSDTKKTEVADAATKATPKNDSKTSTSNEVTPDLTGKQAVDFPGRTSLDTLELTPLPGIYETNITGPIPLAPSVSAKDMPSERLLGRLTPEVFQEMAELERDNTFLKLQIQKETMKNDLEKLRANYRQARLDEIAKREDVVRTRIQWWQEQEKIRQDMEAQRLAVEYMKNEKEEREATQDILKQTPELDIEEDDNDIPSAVEEKTTKPEEETEEVAAEEPPTVNYALISVVGINGALNAKIKNMDTGRWALIRVGDVLIDGSKVKDISPTTVTLIQNDKEVSLTFEDMQ